MIGLMGEKEVMGRTVLLAGYSWMVGCLLTILSLF